MGDGGLSCPGSAVHQSDGPCSAMQSSLESSADRSASQGPHATAKHVKRAAEGGDRDEVRLIVCSNVRGKARFISTGVASQAKPQRLDKTVISKVFAHVMSSASWLLITAVVIHSYVIRSKQHALFFHCSRRIRSFDRNRQL